MIGVLSVSFGIALSSHGKVLGFIFDALVTGILAIVAGAIFCITGVLGIMLYRDQRNHTKNGLHMGFSIIACCISFVAIFFDSEVIR